MNAQKHKKIQTRAIWIVCFCLVATICAIVFMTFNRTNPRISAIIVPHHDLVKDQRAVLFATVAPRTQHRPIVLISTNHYNVGDANIQTTHAALKTKHGTIPSNDRLYAIAQNVGVQDAPGTFQTEHGVYALLPDIAQYYPGQSALALIIKPETPQKDIWNVLDAIKQASPDCLLVSSIDFSHYQPLVHADVHDQLTYRALNTLDADLAYTKAEVGEPQILWATIKWAQADKTTKFVRTNHTNSDELEKQYYEEGTSHMFGWYEQGNKTQSAPEVTFTFVGDTMFDRGVKETFGSAYNGLTSQLGDRVLWGTDVVLANLESPITTRQKYPETAGIPRFSASPAAAHVLQSLHITHVSTANNHSNDAGQAGQADTKTYLASANVAVAPVNKPIIIHGNKHNLAIFTVDRTAGQTITADDIKQTANPDTSVVIYVHWGPEYSETPDKTQVDAAHSWIDAGARMVVGTGTHVIQPAELYKQRPIVYSLGNFIFDHTGAFADSSGLILTGSMTPTGITLQPMLVQSPKIAPVLCRSKQCDTQVDAYFTQFSVYKQPEKGIVYGIQKDNHK